jgi:hypothetical protein
MGSDVGVIFRFFLTEQTHEGVLAVIEHSDVLTAGTKHMGALRHFTFRNKEQKAIAILFRNPRQGAIESALLHRARPHDPLPLQPLE